MLKRAKDGSGDAPVATISDVAGAAGVSTATVSRALSAPGRVRGATRARVLAAVQALGYTPNQAARALRAGASRMVLVVVPQRNSPLWLGRRQTLISILKTALAKSQLTKSISYNLIGWDA